MTAIRLTQYAHGGGCACKIPPGELESVVAGLVGADVTDPAGELVVGLDDGDDAAVVRIVDGIAVIATADFFTPVVDNPYDWGRIAAANALSDVYAMGGRPVVAVNLLGWPREVLPFELVAGTCVASPVATWPVGTAWMTQNLSTAWPSPASSTRRRSCATTRGWRVSPCRSPSRWASVCSTAGTRPPARFSRTPCRQ
jgi:hypothetical protein